MKMLGRKILLKTVNEELVVDIDTIMHCVADGNQCKIKFEDGNEIVALKPLKHMEYYLDDLSFFRINRGIIINLSFVEYCSDEKGMEVKMTDGISFPVAVRRRKDFMEYYKYSTVTANS